MSVLSIGVPVEAIAANTLTVARPLLGLGMLAALFMVFKPLLVGLLRAVLLAFKPRKTRAERSSRRMLQNVLLINRMARDFDTTQPNLANELRALIS